jgi:hypothetical protein
VCVCVCVFVCVCAKQRDSIDKTGTLLAEILESQKPNIFTMKRHYEDTFQNLGFCAWRSSTAASTAKRITLSL